METKFVHVLVIMILLFAGALHGDDEWRQVRAEQGIEVSIHKVEGSSFAESRAVMRLNGVTLPAAVALISDVSHQHEWIAYMDESRVLAEISPVERINYTRSNASWPVADRDAVVRSKFSFDREKGVVRVESQAEPDFIPEKKGVVRIRKVNSSWTLIRISDGELEVRYQVYSEPGGRLPAWMVRRIIYEQPFETLLNMREQLKLAKYRDARFEDFEGMSAQRRSSEGDTPKVIQQQQRPKCC